ncbi:MAG: tRNA-dihydrouridine synthase, partial [Bacteroidales bacterium]|nr:tRNA-dihydrouridine synthase [Bacteroidales bacterium]
EVLNAAAKYNGLKWSLKMRLGNVDKKECLAIIDIINDSPLSFVTIHPRIGKQMYKGSVDLETFADVAAMIKHPVVFNGDIVDTEGVRRISDRFPSLSAVMIGRGILSNPFLPENIKTGNKIFDRKKYLKFSNLLIEGYQNHYNGSEQMTIDKMKTFWEYPLPGVDKKHVKAIQKSRTLSEFVAMVAVGVNGVG